MVDWQRKIGQKQSVVAEGRDIGTVVFPKADYKFYMDADFSERCRRRIAELKKAGKQFNEEELKAELQERDQKDFSRAVGPLKKAEDARTIDSTGLTVEGTVDKIMTFIHLWAAT